MVAAIIFCFLFFLSPKLGPQRHSVEAAPSSGRVGFCYGRRAVNLPSPSQVAEFLTKQSIDLVRIYDSDESVVQAFANTGIELYISVPNSDLLSFQAQKQAEEWVNSFLAPLYPSTNITTITVGAEVVTLAPSMTPLVLPAMKNIHNALTKASLSDKIHVTTTHSMAVLQTSFPPSQSAFNDSFATDFIKPLLGFLQDTGSMFMINAYPYLAYSNASDPVPLNYALFETGQLVTDPTTGLLYESLFDAQIDAIYYAMEGMGCNNVGIVVTETGWPTQGEAQEKGANVQNAAKYNNNLVKRALSNEGTPHRATDALEVFIFSIYDENRKPGIESERHWGIYTPEGNKKYYFDVEGREEEGGNEVPSQSLNVTGATWCVALPGASNDTLSMGLDWACGKGNADCGPIQQGQPCYEPNTFSNHASYAYNSYYQRSGDNSGACNFSGTATITNNNPSYNSCIFPSDSLSPASSMKGNFTSASHSLPPSQQKTITCIFLLLFNLYML